MDRVRWETRTGALQYHTIHKKPAIGICGSGIIEALDAMARAGIVNGSGRLQVNAPGVKTSADGNHELVLVPADQTALGTDLTISQKDVREIQAAKGAIRGGIDTLLAEHDLQPEDIAELLVAGAFGNHISVASAVGIGLFPPVCGARIRQIGNAAGTGAGLMLLSATERAAAEEISDRINYMELAVHPRFTRLFVDSQRFPADVPAEDCQ